jgi:protein KRI1
MPRKKSASKKALEVQEATKREQKLATAEAEVKESIEEEFESESESSSEEEDDFGELITEDVEEGFSKVLDAIRNNDEALLNPEVRFFGNPEEAAANLNKEAKQKPIYLKDYHRMNLLAGNSGADEEFEEDGDAPRTYAEEKEEERNELLSEIKNAFDDEDDEDEGDDGFLKKKAAAVDDDSGKPRKHLPKPDQDGESFLLEFAKQNAWIPQKGDRIINLDKKGEDDEEFDTAAEKFEAAYNFRYEDPNAAEIVSYARTQATVRRDELSGRRKKREAEKQEHEKSKKEKEKLISKKKTEKVNKLADILEQIKKEYGAEINEDIVSKISASLLDKDFDDSQWDTLLAEIFNDEYYNDDNGKPQWDEDDEIMKDFKAESDIDDEEGDESEEADEESEGPPRKKSKKDELKEKKSKKNEKKQIKELAEKAVEKNKLKIIDEVDEEREGRSKDRKETFKYREVSPETFGLTTREIFLADDSELNDFVGLKKLAPYRPKEQRLKDRRKLAKKKNLKDWRKKVFKNADGPEGADSDEIKIPVKDEKKIKKIYKKVAKKEKTSKKV